MCRTHQRAVQRQDSIQLGPRAPRSLQLNKEGDWECPNISLLQTQKRKNLQRDASIKGQGICLLQEGKQGLNKEGDCECPNISLLQPQKRKHLQRNASIKGLGTCLLQEGKSVYFASKALTEAQRGM